LHSLKIIKTTFTDLTHLFKLFLIALNVRIANNRISNLKNLKTWNRTDHDPIWSSSVRVESPIQSVKWKNSRLKLAIFYLQHVRERADAILSNDMLPDS